ncbi:HpcH/HpaI aldolase family protein [Anaerotignum sp.]|uniref:HpcH/HpaI aldolase family protein n=1 Tax=Anaerotignum sp. TaxID=2039241 RepID=UPI00271522EA|nr:aldolase/citrate lyase family protein [Anaerotignum sp.]
MLGTFVKLYSPALIEILGFSGFEFIVVDMEHSSIDFSEAENLVRAAKVANIEVILRIPYAREEHVLHTLDSGAIGVQIPGLTSAEDTENFTKNGKYYPLGNRGLSFNQRSAKYGFAEKNEYIEKSNREGIFVIHIENKEMVDEVEKLCKNPLIDVLFIGPMDLSQSYHTIGQPQSEPVRHAIDKVISMAKKYDKTVGIFAGNTEEAKKYRDMGINYIVCSSDIGHFASGAKKVVADFKK